MRTDDVGSIMGALGNLEDEMQEMEHWYSEAAGWMAEWEKRHAMLYLAQRDVLKESGVWEKGTTETQKKDDIERALQVAYPEEYRELQKYARIKAAGDKLFASRDARRSIGQTLMKPHLQDEGKFGQGARGQAGTPEPPDG